MNSALLPVKEIFSSIQGEGLYAGCRQIFIRVDGCNLACAYCDERQKPLSGNYPQNKLLKEALRIEKTCGPHHSVSLTGGEPLVYADFLCGFLPALKKHGFTVYLETNGTLPVNLKKILGYVDIISMDIKLPSSTKGASLWKEHRGFLSAAKGKDLFVKVVVNRDTKERDVKKASLLVKKAGRGRIPFIIQPVYGFDGYGHFADIACRHLKKDVRIIPQLHKFLSLR